MTNLHKVIALLFMTIWLTTYPPLAKSQQANIENVILNGGFEQGVQPDTGVGYGWVGFSNGEAQGSWIADNSIETVMGGKYSQALHLEGATKADRYIGLYQTVSVVPQQPYKLTIKGLIRSMEGAAQTSNYGYGLQYAIDYEGDGVWEVLKPNEWQTISWNEQPFQQTSAYKFDTVEVVITPKRDKLTMFIRGWKKWVDQSKVTFNLDELSLVGPSPTAQVTVVAAPEQTTASPKKEIPSPFELPITGRSNDSTFGYLVWASVATLLVLFGSAFNAMRHRR